MENAAKQLEQSLTSTDHGENGDGFFVYAYPVRYGYSRGGP